MNTSPLQWSSQVSFSMYEYLLVVHPAKEVYAQLMEEKQSFYDMYKESATFKALPHITVSKFTVKEEMEDTLIRYMRFIFAIHKSFDAMLNNFSGFPGLNTLYIRVQEHKPFRQIAISLKVLDSYIQVNGCPKPSFVSYPHLTIARGLENGIYEKIMLDYSQKTFHASFQVKELVLLRRKSQYEKYEQVNVFRLPDA